MRIFIENFQQHPYTLSVKQQWNVLITPFQSLFSHWKNLEQAVG